MTSKKIIIIAGPNGAGKTTFARQYLPGESACPVFVNADLIAGGLSPFQPEAVAVRAGRLMLQEINDHAKKGESFALETTLAGLGYLKMIDQWRADGYVVKLIFLSLTMPEVSIKRVKFRVIQGGHNIPEDVIRRRFSSGLKNFETRYRHCVNYWQFINNGGDMSVLIEKGEQPMSEWKTQPSIDDDPDMQGVMPALRRAVHNAHKIAHYADTKIVVMRDEKVMEVHPDPEKYPA